jgi:glycosyltransferase involved in cell wall biosynthesis
MYMSVAQKHIIIVLGMHRSGTSVVTKALESLGVDLGQRLMPPLQDNNEKGFFEDLDVYELNETLLETLGHKWHTLEPVQADEMQASSVSGLRNQALELLRSRLATTDLFGMKDPRIPRLLPFWQDVLNHLNARVSYVIACRNPLSVAQSLNKRDRFDLEKGYLLWIEHTLRSLTGTAGMTRLVVDYDCLMDNPIKELQKIAKGLKLECNADPQSAKDFERNFLESSLCHSRYHETDLQENVMVPDDAKELYEILSKLANNAISFDSPQVSAKLQEFEKRFQKNQSLLRYLRKCDDRIILMVSEKNQVLATLAERDAELAKRDAEIAKRDAELVKRDALFVERDALLQSLLTSRSWRMTRPLREVGQLYRRLRKHTRSLRSAVAYVRARKSPVKRMIEIYRHEGWSGIRSAIQKIRLVAGMGCSADIPQELQETLASRASERLHPRVLIVAELSIPQCEKYRVTQKQEMIRSLGYDCTVVNWTDMVSSKSLLSTHSIALFYRVPGYPEVLDVIREAERLNVATYWETDDLIFDRDLIAENPNLEKIDAHVRANLLEGADLYAKAMLHCEQGITSTPGLAEAMHNAGLKTVYVIENALDSQTIDNTSKLLESRQQNHGADDLVRIIYGSGTNTHDADFVEVVPALLDILAKYRNVRLVVIGALRFSSRFTPYSSQIERHPFCSYEDYLALLSTCQISIAPLSPCVFNDAKSNIKFLEAAALKIPSVCSPRLAFRSLIRHGTDGFLCSTSREWFSVLNELVTNKTLRRQVGEAAHALIMKQYTPEVVAGEQVLPLLIDQPKCSCKPRILSVNVFYAPRSFGGATIVAEEINEMVHAEGEFAVYAVTTFPSTIIPAYTVKRYAAKGVDVFGIGIPETTDPRLQFEDPSVGRPVQEIIAAVQPDLVHFHCIQDIGVCALDLCQTLNIPYVVTLHDAWWLCGRQFMLDANYSYCHQENIDLAVCARCVEDMQLNNYRHNRLTTALSGAEKLLAPSQFFADLYVKNGFLPGKVKVNKNGVKRPQSYNKKYRNKPLCFAYVGGNTRVKGVDLVRDVFGSLQEYSVRLIVADNAINLGYSSYPDNYFSPVPDVEIVPAYTQDTIDQFFSGVDVLLFPTQWKESFGLTVREAIARDVWVIATDAGGVSEDIVHGENGFVIPLNDRGTALRNAVIETIERYACMGNDEEIVLKKDHIRYFEDQAAEITQIYRSLIISENR